MGPRVLRVFEGLLNLTKISFNIDITFSSYKNLKGYRTLDVGLTYAYFRELSLNVTQQLECPIMSHNLAGWIGYFDLIDFKTISQVQFEPL